MTASTSIVKFNNAKILVHHHDISNKIILNSLYHDYDIVVGFLLSLHYITNVQSQIFFECNCQQKYKIITLFTGCVSKPGFIKSSHIYSIIMHNIMMICGRLAPNILHSLFSRSI